MGIFYHPAAYVFMGARQPFEPRKLTPLSGVAPGGYEQQIVIAPEVVRSPPPRNVVPTSQQPSLPGSVLSQNNTNQLNSWFEPDALVDLTEPLVEVFTATPTSALSILFPGLTNILAAWLTAPPPQLIVNPNKVTPSGLQLFPGRGRENLTAILHVTWIPPPPQPPSTKIVVTGSAPPYLGGTQVSIQVLNAWIPPAPQPTMPVKMPYVYVPPEPAGKPPKRVPIEVLNGWIPPAPRPIVATNRIPPAGQQLLPGTKIPQQVLNAWIPPPPRPITAINTIPPSGLMVGQRKVIVVVFPEVARAPVAINLTPPAGLGPIYGRGRENAIGLLQDTWIPPAPAPIVANNTLPPSGPGPIFGRGRENLNSVLLQDAWLPPPPTPPLVAINITPPPGPGPVFGRGRENINTILLDAWLPAPPQPITPAQVTAPTPPYVSIGAKIPTTVLIGWIPPPPRPITAINTTPPAGQIIIVGRDLINSTEITQIAWLPPDPWPQAAFPPLQTPPPGPPVFRGEVTPLEVLVAWIPPPPQPPVAINLVPPPGAGPVFGRGRENITGILQDAWIPAPPQPPSAINLIPPSGLGPIPGRSRENTTTITEVSWIPPPPQPPGSVTPALLPPSGPSFQVGMYLPEEILVGWIPPPPMPPLAINLIPPAGAGPVYGRGLYNLTTILQLAWLPAPPRAPTARLGPLYRADPPPNIGGYVPSAVMEHWRLFEPPMQPPLIAVITPQYTTMLPPWTGAHTPDELVHAWDQWLFPQPYYQIGAQIFFQWNPIYAATTKFGFMEARTIVTLV